VKKFPYLKIYSTPQTAALAALVLHNAIEITKGDIEHGKKTAFFNHQEIDLLAQTFRECPYRQETELDFFPRSHSTDAKLTFFNAGHILGAASVLIEYRGKSIFYTGDINLTKQMIQTKAELPKKPVDTLILECTHGGTDSSSLPYWKNETKRFVGEANKIFADGGSILVPVFALGKMQEMLALISNEIENTRLPSVPIYSGGVGRKINSLYDRNRYAVPVNDTDIVLRHIKQENIFRLGNLQRALKTPSIFLATSGMMIPGTISYQLAQSFLREKHCAIFTVGYMDPLSPGYRVQNAKIGEKLTLTDFSEAIPVKCRIENFRFSAHARREDLLHIVDKTQPSRVILVHGDEAARHWVGSAIRKSHRGIKVFLAEPGESISIA
jgi:Cft2 family RNA processing exonuclease